MSPAPQRNHKQFLRLSPKQHNAILLWVVAWFITGAAYSVAETHNGSNTVEEVMRLASLGKHAAATTLFEQIKEQQPDTIQSIHGHKVAVLHAVLGDKERHEAHCRWLMDRYRDAEQPTDAERSVKGYLLFPEADNAALLERALERTRLATDYADARGEGVYLHWFEGSRGIAAYRSKHYEEAATWLEKAAAADNLYISSLALPFRAMTALAQGNREHALALLDEARKMAQQLPAPGSEEYIKEWTDTLSTQLALGEAERLFAAADE